MTALAPPRPVAARPSRRRDSGHLAELGALLVAPLVAFFVLRLRAMAPAGIPDPAMHSVYLWDPRDLVARYVPSVYPAVLRAYVGPRAAYFRWGARPGFLVPGRLAYLAFGAVPGFFALRYVFALLATLPAYLLAKRVWGAWAGALAVAVVLTSPVVITAWGTDFPDSAAVSYLLGGTACLLMPSTARGRRGWALAAAALLTAAVWALATTGVLVAALLLVWLVGRLVAARPGVAREIGLLAAGAVATTLLLAVGSWRLLGRFDFILPTIRAVQFLATPAQKKLWHSSNPAWAPYDTYLLVLPAVVLAWAGAVLFTARRPHPHGRGGPGLGPGPGPAHGSGSARGTGTVRRAQRRLVSLVVGATALVQLVLAAWLQFRGGVQILEEHYLSSSLWAASLLTFVAVLAELAAPLSRRRWSRYLPVGLVVVVAALSEALPTPPALQWGPFGYLLVALVATTAALAPRLRRAPRGTAMAGSGVLLAALLVLTVAPAPQHPTFAHTVYDPVAAYDQALGGRASRLVDTYRLEYELRRWVPNATYRGEQLLTCMSSTHSSFDTDMIGLFHAGDNVLPGSCPRVGPGGLYTIATRQAAQLLVVSPHPMRIGVLMARLAPVHPVIARRTRLRSGRLSCWAWLIEFPRYLSTHSI